MEIDLDKIFDKYIDTLYMDDGEGGIGAVDVVYVSDLKAIKEEILNKLK